MLYLIAFLFPPLAVLACGKPVQALLNVVLTCFFVIPGWIHAMMVVSDHYSDRRTNRVVRAVRESRRYDDEEDDFEERPRRSRRR